VVAGSCEAQPSSFTTGLTGRTTSHFAVSQRAIVVFPQNADLGEVERLRQRFDPLVRAIDADESTVSVCRLDASGRWIPESSVDRRV
jgi:hypothetical protein